MNLNIEPGTPKSFSETKFIGRIEMLTFNKSNRSSLRWLQICVLLSAIIMLSAGAAFAQDFVLLFGQPVLPLFVGQNKFVFALRALVFDRHALKRLAHQRYTFLYWRLAGLRICKQGESQDDGGCDGVAFHADSIVREI